MPRNLNGMSRKHRKEYLCWLGIIRRCSNEKDKDYKSYGGRGISYSDEWKSFFNFFSDLGKAPTSNHSIDRIDVNGNYEFSNCRWATRIEQENNKRRSIRIMVDGKEMTIKEISEAYGIHKDTINQRFRNKWNWEKIILPARKRKFGV